MSRHHLSFTCEGCELAGTLDGAAGTIGLLWVSGGNEIRSGAFAGQAQIAAKLVQSDFPVFRFDRRGIGDSTGENRGFRHSRADIVAALAAFRANAPRVSRVVGFGNCDAASALMLAGGAGCDALVLSNPWTLEDDAGDAGPPPSAIRARYIEKLRNPREVARLLAGGVNFRKLLRGLARAAAPKSAPTTLAGDMRTGLAEFVGPVRILLAERDRTAQIFIDSWDADDERISRCPGAGHAYVESDARIWLVDRLIEALRA